MLAGLRGLVSGPRWTRPRIEAFQAERLRALVRHAYLRVPYYRRLFDRAGLKPDQIRTLRDLGHIPITSRADLQAVPDRDIIAEGFDPATLVVHRTSGSSGEPLNIRRTRYEDRLLQAYRLRILFRLGMRTTDRRVAVVSPRLLKAPLYTRAGLLRYDEVSCTLSPDQILLKLREARPDVLRGYPSALACVADVMTDTDREVIRPRFITTDSEMCTSGLRDRIRQGFRAGVVDFYDSHEFNVIAWECVPGGPYHVSDLSTIAEVMRDDRAAQPGERGELVGTALHSWAMPFIRVRLGDLVTRGPRDCPCGAPNTVVADVHGRIVDRFELPNGRSVHPYTLVRPLLTHGPWVRQYQIIQEQSDRIRVKLVPLEGPAPTDALSVIRRVLSERLGEGVAVDVEIVAAIPPAPSGKSRPYLSLVSSTGRAAMARTEVVGR